MKSLRRIWPGLVLVFLPLALPAFAQPGRDQLTLLNEETGSRVRIACTIVNYTGEFVRYRIREDGPVSVKASSRVIAIDTPQTRPHVDGLIQWAGGNVSQAIPLFEKALEQESREWVRRDLLAMLVRCALRQDDPAQAGRRFLMLYQSDQTTRYFSLIPLLWTTSPPSDALKTEAMQWMAGSSPAETLLAASALLFDPKHQSSAAVDLRRLGVNSDGRVRELAKAQLWRLDLQRGKLDNATLTLWEDSLRSMPDDLRGGAHFVLGEARKRRRQYDQAAASLLWVPLVYNDDYQLAALACLDAAECLRAIGQRTEAATLYREVTLRYRDSRYAQDAAQILKSLSDAPAESSPEPTARRPE